MATQLREGTAIDRVPDERGPVCAAGDQPAPVRAEPDGGQRFGVAGHLRLHLARPAAPQTPDPVAAPGGDALAVGAERNAPDGALVPDQDALGRAGIWALRPPDSRRPIEAAGHDAGPLRAEGDRGHLPGVPAQLDQDLTG